MGVNLGVADPSPTGSQKSKYNFCQSVLYFKFQNSEFQGGKLLFKAAVTNANVEFGHK